MALNRFIIDKGFDYSPSKGFSFVQLNMCEGKFEIEEDTKIHQIKNIKDSIIKSGVNTPSDFAVQYLEVLDD